MNDLQIIREKITPLHVLIVDDEDAIREGTINFMKKFCGHVDGAHNGEAALKMVLEQGPYDIVLTDVRMPKMSGWLLAKELRKLKQGIFVAVMTGSPEMDGIQNEDCDLYMPKPIDIGKMKLILETLIEKKSL